MKVLGIFPTFQQLDYCQRAVETFLANTPDSEALVVDDGTPLKEWKRHQDWLSKIRTFRFDENDQNPTRGWNYGLGIAREQHATYAICGNSDLLFGEGWFIAIEDALGFRQIDLAGPITNAPGPTVFQQVSEYLSDYRLTDDMRVIDHQSRVLRERYGAKIVHGSVNGFCLAARTATWWKGQYDANVVFNPKKKMIGAEDELQRRWKRLGLKYGAVLGSFVFHYKYISRGIKPWNKTGVFRPQKPL